MPRLRRDLTLRLTLLTLSTLLSVGAAELFLRIYASRFETPSAYRPAPDGRHDDIYELYPDQAGKGPYQEKVRILTLGDSFTNGGNVDWRDSYPYRLFEMSGRSREILNMGICEDTTKGSYLRLADHFRRNPGKPAVVVLLVGAADQFFEDGPRFEEVYRQAIGGKGIPVQEMRIEAEPRGLERSLFYRMVRYLARRAGAALQGDTSPHIPSLKRVRECLQSRASRPGCLREELLVLAGRLPEKYDMELFKGLISTIVHEGSADPRGKDARITGDLLEVIRTLPRSLAVTDMVFNTVTYGSLQSRYDLKDEIIRTLREKYAEEKSFIDSHARPDLDHPSELIGLLEKWSSQFEKARQLRESYLERIIGLVRARRARLILMTYPVTYPQANDAIRRAAARSGVPLVDLEKIFAEKGHAENLIGDWEHCTPEGYSLIAEALRDPIRDAVRALETRP